MSNEEPSGADRRRHPRYELLAQVRVKGTQSDLVMSLSNISHSGALVDMGSLDTPPWIDVGRELEVGIVHPDSLDLIEVRGRVVRLTKDEKGCIFALEFLEPTSEARAGLRELVVHASTLPPAKKPPPLP
ncbi:MAG: PilZ domain-containing protein [Polyangiaceae bacterium]